MLSAYWTNYFLLVGKNGFTEEVAKQGNPGVVNIEVGELSLAQNKEGRMSKPC